MNRTHVSRLLRRVPALALATTLALAGTAHAQEWQWRILPYVWAAGVSTDVKVNDHELDGGTGVEMKDVIDSLDFATMLHFEGQRGHHGFLLDTLYINLGDEDLVRSLARPAGATLHADGDLRALVQEVAGLYNPHGDGTGFSLIYGARLLDVQDEVKARFDLANGGSISRDYKIDKTFWDGMVGARYIGVHGEHWRSNVRADVSAGGTELSWSANAGAGYAFNQQHEILAGFHYTSIELKENDQRAEVKSTLTLSGLYFGYQYSF